MKGLANERCFLLASDSLGAEMRSVQHHLRWNQNRPGTVMPNFIPSPARQPLETWNTHNSLALFVFRRSFCTFDVTLHSDKNSWTQIAVCFTRLSFCRQNMQIEIQGWRWSCNSCCLYGEYTHYVFGLGVVSVPSTLLGHAATHATSVSLCVYGGGGRFHTAEDLRWLMIKHVCWHVMCSATSGWCLWKKVLKVRETTHTQYVTIQ